MSINIPVPYPINTEIDQSLHKLQTLYLYVVEVEESRNRKAAGNLRLLRDHLLVLCRDTQMLCLLVLSVLSLPLSINLCRFFTSHN